MEGTTALRERFDAIYTAALADILDTRGYRTQTLPPSIRPLERGMRLAGPAFTVSGKPVEDASYDTRCGRCCRCSARFRPVTSPSTRARRTSPRISASSP